MNKVIKVLDLEHGKKVINWWKKQGVDTKDFQGITTLKEGCKCIYYGVIDNMFNNYDIKEVNEHNATIITLPEDGVFTPRFMMVKDRQEQKSCKRFVFAYKAGVYVAWVDAETLEEVEKTTHTKTWNFAEEILEQPIVELTLQEIANKLKIDAALLRIKK